MCFVAPNINQYLAFLWMEIRALVLHFAGAQYAMILISVQRNNILVS